MSVATNSAGGDPVGTAVKNTLRDEFIKKYGCSLYVEKLLSVAEKNQLLIRVYTELLKQQQTEKIMGSVRKMLDNIGEKERLIIELMLMIG
jgi:hypothetical protein